MNDTATPQLRQRREASGPWGTLIRRKRLAKNIRQEDLAATLGVYQATVSGWETGGGIPSSSMQSALVRVLEITADELHAVVSGAAA